MRENMQLSGQSNDGETLYIFNLRISLLHVCWDNIAAHLHSKH